MAKDAQLRLMAATDLDVCRALWQGMGAGAGPELMTQENLKRFIARNPLMSWVACDEDGKVIGCVLCGTDTWRGYVYYLVVGPAHRHRGIGGQLLDRAVRGLQRFGSQKVVAVIPRGQPDSGLLYVDHGWYRRNELEIYTADLGVVAAPE